MPVCVYLCVRVRARMRLWWLGLGGRTLQDDTTTITLRLKVGEEELSVEVCPTTTLAGLKTYGRDWIAEGRVA